ncbi:unnamed protein product [Effrenium voratum]|nr:unnamed protein product [Effrenium voratum]
MGANQSLQGYAEAEQNLPLEALGEDFADKIFEQLGDVLGRTVRNLRAAGRRHFFTLPNCWELFGADFLVTRGGSALLLEVNPSPSMAMFGGLPLPSKPLEEVTAGWHQLQL